jgi:hypothetical protein
VNGRDTLRAVTAVGVVLPVHDEEDLLPDSLHGLELAVDALPPSISCRVAIVLDRCGDASSAIAHTWGARFGAHVSTREGGSVGMARRAGAGALLSLWSERDPASIWLATTDADSRVPVDWLVVQLQASVSGADMWAGRVRVAEESAAARRWTQRYSTERHPVHGASLGFSASLYTRLGGFGEMRSGEDRDLHHRAAQAGCRIAYDFRAAVTTSSRRKGRAPDGFAKALEEVDQEELGATA